MCAIIFSRLSLGFVLREPPAIVIKKKVESCYSAELLAFTIIQRKEINYKLKKDAWQKNVSDLRLHIFPLCNKNWMHFDKKVRLNLDFVNC